MFYVCLSIYVYYMYVDTHKGQKSALDHLELEL